MIAVWPPLVDLQNQRDRERACPLDRSSNHLKVHDSMTEVHDPTPRPRLLPERAFPAYAHVPRVTPHPLRDPSGHSYRMEPGYAGDISRWSWPYNETYLHAIDLFNFGYYWEAHEAWESLWNGCGRQGTLADFLKGLIKLAAAGVKVREQIPQGAQKHARRARELFESVQRQTSEPLCLGLDLAALKDATRTLEVDLADSKEFPLPIVLRLHELRP